MLLLLCFLVFAVQKSLTMYALPPNLSSLLKHCKPEVKWVLNASGIGFQVPPEDIYIASVVPSSVKALKKQIDFVCIRWGSSPLQ